MSIKKGYFACPLAGGDESQRAKAMVGLIEKMGFVVLDRHVIFPHGQGKGEFCKNSGIKTEDFNPQTVRRQDLDWVIKSEFMVLDCSVGSWGGGIELDHATVVRRLLRMDPIPILCLKQKDTKPSYLVWGIDTKEFPKIWLREYGCLKEAFKIITEFFEHFFPNEEGFRRFLRYPNVS